MKRPESCLHIGLIILSADFRVIGMNVKELRNPGANEPRAMVIDVLNKVLMINLCQLNMFKERGIL